MAVSKEDILESISQMSVMVFQPLQLLLLPHLRLVVVLPLLKKKRSLML
jgi:ABC-type transporter Mla maintaining outer membrane lipid asymmetry permease subunit MlaE